MENYKKLNIMVLFALLACTFFFACDKHGGCPGLYESTSYMGEEYRNKLPYSGIDTLSFVINNKDTLVFMGQGRLVFFEPYYQTFNGGDCAINNKINYEGNNMFFEGKSCSIKISQTICPCSNSSLALDYNAQKYLFNISSLGARYSSAIPYYDSLIINGSYYYGVNAFVSDGDSIYISKSHGFIRLKSERNNFEFNFLNLN